MSGSTAIARAAIEDPAPSPSTRARQGYRAEIDGLRAIAVLAVILFHSGFLPNGYLGVDVFFVISGYLITGIIHDELVTGRFSLAAFYTRRVRRILPLSLVIGAVALAIGVAFMLPDDLENLAQSVIATNLFANNILQAITTRNYWDVVNDFKPMLHTWSLGVEEQFYFAFPLLLMVTWKVRRAWVLPVVAGVALVSLALYLAPFAPHQKFFFLPFRFFEIAAGSVAALAFAGRTLSNRLLLPFILLLMGILVAGAIPLPAALKVILVVAVTVGILVSEVREGSIAGALLRNRVAVWLGLISYGLYMWHQVLLAFARYVVEPELRGPQLVVLYGALVAAATLTYHFVERPFRNARMVGVRTLFGVCAAVFLLSTGAALFVYQRAGVLKDVPELGIRKASVERGMHAAYNQKVFEHERDFTRSGKRRVLVLGNSFARDFVNVLLELPYADRLEVSYAPWPDPRGRAASRAAVADLVFLSDELPSAGAALRIDPAKLWGVGTKNFGKNNGVFYNRRGEGFLQQRAHPDAQVLERNELLRSQWGPRFVDLLGKVVDAHRTVPVFTPSGQFISQDCRHFTRAGAAFYAELLSGELDSILLGTSSEGASERPAAPSAE